MRRESLLQEADIPTLQSAVHRGLEQRSPSVKGHQCQLLQLPLASLNPEEVIMKAAFAFIGIAVAFIINPVIAGATMATTFVIGARHVDF